MATHHHVHSPNEHCTVRAHLASTIIFHLSVSLILTSQTFLMEKDDTISDVTSSIV